MVATVLPPVASSLVLRPERLAESRLLLWQKHVFAFASLVLLSVWVLFGFLRAFSVVLPISMLLTIPVLLCPV